MADPLTIVGASASCLQIAGQVITLTIALVELYSKVKDAPGNVKDQLTHLLQLSNIVKKISQTPSLQSPPIRDSLSSLNSILSKLREALNKNAVSASDGDFTRFRKGFLSLVKEKEVAASFSKLEREKASLALCMHQSDATALNSIEIEVYKTQGALDQVTMQLRDLSLNVITNVVGAIPMLSSDVQAFHTTLKTVDFNVTTVFGTLSSIEGKVDVLLATLLPLADEMRARLSEISQAVEPQPTTVDFPRGEKRLRSDAADLDQLHAEIFKSLSFPSMNSRLDQIEDAHKATFEWVFDDGPNRDGARFSLSNWFRTGQGIFWIHGKAGSGKSTFMRFLAEHAKTQQELSSWGGTDQLIIASYFMWLSGSDPLLKTMEGMLRTLLFQIFEQQPLLLSSVPLRNVRLPNSRVIVPNEWTKKTLAAALKALASQTTIPLKICLFIDGLDELEGMKDNIDALVDLLEEVALQPSWKICVSSRPETACQYRLGKYPQLKLQDLTRRDIEAYVEDWFKNQPLLSRLARRQPAEMEELNRAIVSQAGGVFLWVKLALRKLENGLKDRDTVAELKEAVNSLPKELNELFDQMLSRHGDNPARAKQAWQYFLIVLWFYQPHLVMMALADNELTYPTEIDELHLAYYPLEESTDMCQAFEARLASRCCGLLETQSVADFDWSSLFQTDSASADHSYLRNTRVAYHHRTVADYLCQREESVDIGPVLEAIVRAVTIWVNSYARAGFGNKTDITTVISTTHKMIDNLRAKDATSYLPKTLLESLRVCVGNALRNCTDVMEYFLFDWDSPGTVPLLKSTIVERLPLFFLALDDDLDGGNPDAIPDWLIGLGPNWPFEGFTPFDCYDRAKPMFNSDFLGLDSLDALLTQP